MGMFDWLLKNNADKEDGVVVKSLKSKGGTRQRFPVTVGDIKKGIAYDNNGYPNEVVLFLRLNKKDR